MEFEMSRTFKVALSVIALGAITLAYLSAQNISAWDAQTSPHQSLEEMKATGNIEVRSFKEWRTKNKGSGARFQAWQKPLKDQRPPAPLSPQGVPPREPSVHDDTGHSAQLNLIAK